MLTGFRISLLRSNPLSKNKTFPLSQETYTTFETLKKEIAGAVLVTIDPKLPLVVETDAFDFAITATLNQNG